MVPAELFHDAFQSSPIGIALENLEGQPLFVNAALCSMLGLSEEEMRGKHCTDFSPQEDADKDQALFAQLRAGLIDHYTLDKRFFRRDGSLIWGRLRISLLHDCVAPLVVAMVEDITDKRKAQDTLELASDQMNAAVARCGRDFRYKWVNKRGAELLQRSVEEIVGHTVSEVLGRDTFEILKEYFDRVLSGQEVSYEHELNYPGVGHKWVSGTYSPTFDGDGLVDGWVATVIDITEKKRAELVLRESEERFRLVSNSAPVMIWMAGTDKRCDYFNLGWLNFTGRPLEAELGNGWAESVHPDDLERCFETYSESFDRREPFEMEYRLRRHDGEYRWLLDRGVPRFDGDGTFAGYIGSCIDTTERRQAQTALSGLSQRLLEAQEEERSRIGRELHDDINQRLGLVAVHLDIVKSNLFLAPEVSEQLGELSKQLEELGTDVQALSHRLHSSKLEYLGLQAAAASLCKELSALPKVKVEFQAEGVPRQLPREVSLCLFRVLQESLQNAIKHSGANEFSVSLAGGKEEIQLTVHDSGIGFDWDDAVTRGGIGLLTMQERLKVVNGTLSVESSRRGSGTTIRACVPLEFRAKAAAAGE